MQEIPKATIARLGDSVATLSADGLEKRVIDLLVHPPKTIGGLVDDAIETIQALALLEEQRLLRRHLVERKTVLHVRVVLGLLGLQLGMTARDFLPSITETAEEPGVTEPVRSDAQTTRDYQVTGVSVAIRSLGSSGRRRGYTDFVAEFTKQWLAGSGTFTFEVAISDGLVDSTLALCAKTDEISSFIGARFRDPDAAFECSPLYHKKTHAKLRLSSIKSEYLEGTLQVFGPGWQ